MKTKIYFLILLLALILLSTLIFAQGVAINEDESPAHPSAMLDVKSNNKGMLLPRLTLLEVAAIESPAEGLMLYCTDCHETGALVIFIDGRWSAIDQSVGNSSLSTPINQNYGSSGWEFFADLDITSESGYIVCGSSDGDNYDVGNNYGLDDIWLLKLDQTGAIAWEKTWGSDGDGAGSVQTTNDGGYIVVGSSSSTDYDVGGNNGSSDYWIVKLDISGNIEWATNRWKWN
ncbi:MAG: hypothetical protein R2764_22450 [Bacteroidales bacterium]